MLHKRLAYVICKDAFKVRKSQKQFFLKLIALKTNKILNKILPYEARAEFCLIFCSFFGAMEFQEKLLLRFTDFKYCKFDLSLGKLDKSK